MRYHSIASPSFAQLEIMKTGKTFHEICREIDILTTSGSLIAGGYSKVIAVAQTAINRSRKLAQNPLPEGSPADYGDLGAIEPPDTRPRLPGC